MKKFTKLEIDNNFTNCLDLIIYIKKFCRYFLIITFMFSDFEIF